MYNAYLVYLAPNAEIGRKITLPRQLYASTFSELSRARARVVSKLYNSLNYDIMRARYLIQRARKLDEGARADVQSG